MYSIIFAALELRSSRSLPLIAASSRGPQARRRVEKCKTRLDHVLVEFCLTGYALVGGRVAYLEHEPGAHLLYDVDAHQISVFIFRNRPQDRT